jgi:hypothetical protein
MHMLSTVPGNEDNTLLLLDRNFGDLDLTAPTCWAYTTLACILNLLLGYRYRNRKTHVFNREGSTKRRKMENEVLFSYLNQRSDMVPLCSQMHLLEQPCHLKPQISVMRLAS